MYLLKIFLTYDIHWQFPQHMKFVFFLYIPMPELQSFSFTQLCLLRVRPRVSLMVLTIREPPMYAMVANVLIEFFPSCEVAAFCRNYAFSLNYGNWVNSCVAVWGWYYCSRNSISFLKNIRIITPKDDTSLRTLTFALCVGAYAVVVVGEGVVAALS